MSRRCVEWAYQQACGSPQAKFLLVTIADFADEAETCFPGQEELARLCDMSPRTVRSHLTRLEEAGLLLREARMRGTGRGRGRTSDRYVLAGPTGETFRLVEQARQEGDDSPQEAPQSPSAAPDDDVPDGRGPTGEPLRLVDAPTGNSATTNRQLSDDQPEDVFRARSDPYAPYGGSGVLT